MPDPAGSVTPPARPTPLDYAVVLLVLSATILALVQVSDAEPQPLPPNQLVPPIAAMLGLTAILWIAMALARNLLVAVGRVSMRYFHSYVVDPPAELVERPARTFNNQMELPQVFYVVCLLAMTLGRVDRVVVELAWLYVGLRVAHAVVMLGWNRVPHRFAFYAASTITLGTLAVHVAERGWPTV